MKKYLLIALVGLFSISAIAQSKVGTVDVEFIVGNMTVELENVQAGLKTYEDELSVDLKEKMSDYEAKYKAYQAAEATMSDADKKAKQDEILAIENDIVKYRQNGSQLLSIRRDELMAPVYQKIGVALDAEAKAQGYSQIMDTGSGALTYADPNFDITEAVMKRMGVTVKQQPKEGN